MTDQANDLRALALRSVVPRVPATAHAARRIVVFGGKGGVGTTTLAFNLAVALSQQGTRSLLVDASGGDAALLARLEPDHTLADVLSGDRTVNQIMQSGPGNIHILPASRESSRSGAGGVLGWNRVLSELSEPLPGIRAIVFDAGSRPDEVARSLWKAADQFFVVATPETAAVMNAYAAIKLLSPEGQPERILSIVNTAHDAPIAHEIHERLAQACQRFLAIRLARGGYIPSEPEVPKAASRGKPFVLTAPASLASRNLRQLARSLNVSAEENIVEPIPDRCAA